MDKQIEIGSEPWSYFLDDWPFPEKQLTRVLSLKVKVEECFKKKISIPDEYRSRIWRLMEQLDQWINVNNPNNVDKYQECLNLKNEDIETDVATDAVRTFPSSQYKKKMISRQNGKKESLYNVLKSYAMYNSEVQYTQGMNYLSLVLLCYFSEQDSFWMMDLLIKKHGMRHFFRKNEPFLPSYLRLFEIELGEKIPKLAGHLQKEGIHMYMFIQGWWSTIFVYIIPMESIPIVWDYFFWGANGMGIEVLFRLSLALLKILQDDLFLQKWSHLLGFN
eukprot:gene8417-10336_t